MNKNNLNQFVSYGLKKHDALFTFSIPFLICFISLIVIAIKKGQYGWYIIPLVIIAGSLATTIYYIIRHKRLEARFLFLGIQSVFGLILMLIMGNIVIAEKFYRWWVPVLSVLYAVLVFGVFLFCIHRYLHSTSSKGMIAPGVAIGLGLCGMGLAFVVRSFFPAMDQNHIVLGILVILGTMIPVAGMMNSVKLYLYKKTWPTP